MTLVSSDVPEGYKHVPCNLCGADSAETYATCSIDADWVVHRTRVRCRKCGLVYSDPQASERTLASFYSRTYPVSCVPDKVQTSESQISAAKQLFERMNGRGRPGRVLDVGCATGHFLAGAQAAGWETYGVEVSTAFVDYARNTLGLKNVYVGCLRDTSFDDGFFDFVNMWHVLEHVADPIGELTEIRRLLKIGGELRLGVPTLDDPHYWIDRLICRCKGMAPPMRTSDHHTYEFTRRTLSNMLEAVGLHVKEVELYFNPRDSLRHMNWKGKTEDLAVSAVSRLLAKSFGDRLRMAAVKL
ncbi:MAG: class I SAM-dependent methyltransferase [Chloroflexi bacterium]|nr:class I SAM-dependent methyltransferase [Chloroflexota bacterium]